MTLPVLILNARPAAGKSEIIAFLKSLDNAERSARYHLGRILEIDDFPMLWTWFEEDTLLAEMGYARIHTDGEGYFLHHGLWNLLLRRIALEYDKIHRDGKEDLASATVIVEFSRGSEHGGYREAYPHLGRRILETASVLYIDVSYEESVRKNTRRFNPDKPDSILEHGLPMEKMERLYKEIDWNEFVSDDPRHLHVDEYRLPYVVMDNSDDVTTLGGRALAERLEACLNSLWECYTEGSTHTGRGT